MLPVWVHSAPHAFRGFLVSMFFLTCMLSVSVDARGEDFQWTTELLSDLHDQSLMAFETAEKLGRKVIGLAPVLQYSSSLELAGVSLKPAKYWFGIRLPKNLSKLPTAYPAMKPDDFIRCSGLWVIPLGAAIDIPLRRGSALTIAVAVNIGGQTPFQNFLPGVTFAFKF
jgi:hypothetical protein